MVDISLLPLTAIVGVITGLIGSFIAFKIEAGINTARIKEVKEQLKEIKKDVKERLGSTIEERILIVNDNLAEQLQKIETANEKISFFNHQIKIIELEANRIVYQHNKLSSILETLDELKDEHDNIQNAEKFLEIVNAHSDEISIINQFKEQLSRFEDVQKFPKIIGIGWEKLSTGNMTKVDEQTWTKIIEFGDQLKDPENTKVFVALTGIEAKISNEGKKIRSYLYVEPKSIT